ncbi:MAG: hypothetical protein ACF8PN_09900 [Phycisphaerales bacterium]
MLQRLILILAIVQWQAMPISAIAALCGPTPATLQAMACSAGDGCRCCLPSTCECGDADEPAPESPATPASETNHSRTLVPAAWPVAYDDLVAPAFLIDSLDATRRDFTMTGAPAPVRQSLLGLWLT